MKTTHLNRRAPAAPASEPKGASPGLLICPDVETEAGKFTYY